MRRGRVRALRAILVSALLGSRGIAFAADEIHWTITGPTSVTFDWRGSASEKTIAYGLSAGGYSSTVNAVNPAGTCVPYSSSGPFWEAKLTNLSPNTLYHYSIANGPDHSFRTPPPAGTASFQILVEADIGDSGTYPTVTGNQQLLAQESNARFVLAVGDLTYADDHGLSHADQHFNDVMPWSRDVAYMPAWGNHDWDGEPADDLRNYKGRFDFANPQTSVGTPSVSDCGEDWYWFDYGNTRFIAYPEPWTGAWADWNTQATSLMNAAQADPNIAWIVTFGHRPAYSSGHHSGSTTLQGYLGELAASHSKYVLNLNGHSHNYERTYPQNGSGDNLRGAVHVTVGTGGSSLESDGQCLWLACTQPPWSAVRYFHLGYLRLSFTPTSIQGAFVCGPAGAGANDITCTPGSVIDSFTIVPSEPPPTLYVDQASSQCSDAGPGSASQPFCTITQGVTRAVAGNTVIVRAGTYPEDIKMTKSGTSTQPIVIEAEPGANVVVSGQFRGFEISKKSWITIRGFTVSDTSSYGIYVSSGSSNIEISGNHVSRAGQPVNGSTKAGIYLSNTTNSIVSGNTTDYNSDAGIFLVSGSTNNTISGNVSSFNARGYTRAAPGIDVRSGSNIIKGNICHDNEDSGIQIFAGGPNIPSPNNLVVGNLSYNNGDHGIDVSSAGSQWIVGNTVYGSGTSGINIEGPSSGTTLRNNIAADNAIGGGNTGNVRVDSYSLSGTTMDYDLVQLGTPGTLIQWNGVNYATLAAFASATGQESHGLQASPSWSAPSSGDFHLSAGSPAIDSADSGATGESPTDLDGSARVDDPGVTNTGAGPRAYDDRGAYEHPICGNGIKEQGEDCDGTDIGVAVCSQLGCTGGEPVCSAQCTLNYESCTGCPVCGNGVKEYGEDCDGSDLGGASCESLGECSTRGGLACTTGCRFNMAGCSCGDGAVQSGCGEVCDGTNLAGQTCESQGYPGGTLACKSDCTAFQTSGCGHWGGALYVDQANPACTDAGQGTQTNPFCTINGAAAKVTTGGTVIVSSGNYPEYVKILTPGTSTAPIVFKAAPGATVNVTGQQRGFELSSKSYVTIEGFAISSTTQYGIYVSNSSNVTIRNNHVSHAGAPSSGNTYAGIYVSSSFDSSISGNTTDNNSDSGVFVTSNSSNVTVTGNTSAHNARGYTTAASGIEIRSAGNTISGNICHDNEDSGIAIKPFGLGSPSPNNLIVKNLTYHNGTHGIAINGSQSQRIVGNTVYSNTTSGIDLSTTSSQSVIANNITVDNALGVGGASGGNVRVDASSVPGTTLDYDLVFRSQPGTMMSWNGVAYATLAAFVTAAGQEAHGLQGDPEWVAPAAADFRLTVGSGAIDSADSSVSGESSSDINGIPRTDDPATGNTGMGPRSYDDRGAYEYPLDADDDGYASDEDCDDMDPTVFPGAPEVNDGKDNQCPHDFGYGLIDETSGDSGFHSPGDKSTYSWPAQAGATSFEAARANAPDFSSGCQSIQTTAAQWIDSAIPDAGQGFYYLNRPRTPFAGSWGAHSWGASRTVTCSPP